MYPVRARHDFAKSPAGSTSLGRCERYYSFTRLSLVIIELLCDIGLRRVCLGTQGRPAFCVENDEVGVILTFLLCGHLLTQERFLFAILML